jgi:hypothetical protein
MRYLLYAIIVVIDLYAIWLPASSKTFEIKPPVMDTAYEETMALEYLNALRQNAGMAPYATSEILTKAAKNHATYLITNHEAGHYETKGKPGFTGKMPYERAIHAGYKVAMLTENVTNNSLNYKDAIDNLFSAIYHRFGFLDFISDEIGIGVAQDRKDTDYNAFVFDMGVHDLNEACSGKSYSGPDRYAYKICVDPLHRIQERRLLKILSAQKIASKAVVLYPYDGQDDVPPVFYNETPDPLPDYDVSGFPITVQFNDYYIRQASVHSISLFDPDGNELKSKILYDKNDPNHMMKPGQYALLPLTRLAYDTTYSVVLKYTSGGKKIEKRWHFHTRKLPKPYFVIDKNHQKITIKPGTAYTLYFPPHNAHDTLDNLHFPADVRVRFLDQNTIQLKLESKNREPFTFKSGERAVQIEVI